MFFFYTCVKLPNVNVLVFPPRSIEIDSHPKKKDIVLTFELEAEKINGPLLSEYCLRHPLNQNIKHQYSIVTPGYNPTLSQKRAHGQMRVALWAY